MCYSKTEEKKSNLFNFLITVIQTKKKLVISHKNKHTEMKHSNKCVMDKLNLSSSSCSAAAVAVRRT